MLYMLGANRMRVSKWNRGKCISLEIERYTTLDHCDIKGKKK